MIAFQWFPVYFAPDLTEDLMRILVTGGNGLTGRYIVSRLARDHEVEVLDRRAIERPGIRTHQADILDLGALKSLTRGFETVVHCAAIPNPLEHPPEQVYSTNTVGTFNVLEASAANNVRRVVFMSSESVLGFAFSGGAVEPEYLPVDEDHPLRPVDAYGLSKSAGESLCAAYARRGALETVCLRPSWIWVPEEAELRRYRELIFHPEAWRQTLWAYVHVLDLAEAVVGALQSPLDSGHATCFVGAAENWTGRDSRDLAREFFPRARILDAARSGPYSLVSLRGAERLLGYRPRYSMHDLPGFEHP